MTLLQFKSQQNYKAGGIQNACKIIKIKTKKNNEGDDTKQEMMGYQQRGRIQ